MAEPGQRGRTGRWLDEWTPRLLKILGLLGMLLSLVAYVITKQFEPILFGGSLTAASGGYLGDAVNALKQAKPG
jgi:hypothetical protein